MIALVAMVGSLAGDTFDRCSWLWRLFLCPGCKAARCPILILFVLRNICPLRWIYYKYKKWQYILLDFCYYANTIVLIMLLFCPRNEKLFMVCFSFAEGPLAWALIVWRNSLVFNSVDKIVSVFIHLLPVAQTREMLSKQEVHTRKILSKHALKIAKQAEEHERFISKVTHLIGVLGFGGFCFVLGARFLCYYANTIFLIMLLFCPRNEKLFVVCFSFAEGPLAWALIVWRNSLVFNSVDKIVSVFIHLLPGLVFFTILWWDTVFFEAMRRDGSTSRASWPNVEDKSCLWTWIFFVPLAVYIIWLTNPTKDDIF